MRTRPIRVSRTVIALLVAAALLPAGPAPAQPAARLDVFRGIGAWIDIYDYRQWAEPEGTVQELASHGVQTLYLESTSYRRKGPIRYPERTVRFLDAAHAAGIAVVAWYVPGFADLEQDLEWSLAAVDLQTPSGNRFDAFGLDIEVTIVADPHERARRVVELSEAIRAAVGPAYPLAAVAVSPMRSPGYWPVFPDRELAAIFDVYMPMSYWTYRVDGGGATYDFIAETVRRVKERTGRPDIPIHVIGGETGAATAAEMGAFVRAVQDAEVLGASIYDVAGAGPEEWAAMQALRFVPKPPQEPSEEGPDRLRFGVDLGAFGRAPGADPRKRVVFGTGPLSGGWEIDYEGFDLGDREVALVVNGRRVVNLAPTDEESWSERRTLAVDGRFLRARASNSFAFEPTAGILAAGAWGIRRASLVAEPIPLEEEEGAQGLLRGADQGRADRVTYRFQSLGGPMAVRVRGFDLVDDEVRVLLNGYLVAVLAPTGREVWGESQTILLQDVRAGDNLLTFDSLPNPFREDPWGVRVRGSASAALV